MFVYMLFPSRDGYSPSPTLKYKIFFKDPRFYNTMLFSLGVMARWGSIYMLVRSIYEYILRGFISYA